MPSVCIHIHTAICARFAAMSKRINVIAIPNSERSAAKISSAAMLFQMPSRSADCFDDAKDALRETAP